MSKRFMFGARFFIKKKMGKFTATIHSSRLVLGNRARVFFFFQRKKEL